MIWDLPLGRFRQITAAIQQRRYFASREESSRTSWLARTLATFIAGGYMTDGKSENKAVQTASKLAYDDIEAAALSEAEAPAVVPENGIGSFERFMGMMGGLDQRGKML